MDDFHDHPVRTYVLTSGRAHPSRNTLRPETLVRAVPGHRPPSGRLEVELVRVCSGTLALAEVAAYLGHPVSLVAVMVSDLVDSGHLAIRSNYAAHVQPDTATLEKVLDGLRNL